MHIVDVVVEEIRVNKEVHVRDVPLDRGILQAIFDQTLFEQDEVVFVPLTHGFACGIVIAARFILNEPFVSSVDWGTAILFFLFHFLSFRTIKSSPSVQQTVQTAS